MEKPGTWFALAKYVKCESVTRIFITNFTVLTTLFTYFSNIDVNLQSVYEGIKSMIAEIQYTPITRH